MLKDWKCGFCGSHNGKFRTTCNNCGEPELSNRRTVEKPGDVKP